MMESDAGAPAGSADNDADTADVQDQLRSDREDGVDPEQIVEQRLPDGASIEADAADVQDQSLEVVVDDDDG